MMQDPVSCATQVHQIIDRGNKRLLGSSRLINRSSLKARLQNKNLVNIEPKFHTLYLFVNNLRKVGVDLTVLLSISIQFANVVDTNEGSTSLMTKLHYLFVVKSFWFRLLSIVPIPVYSVHRLVVSWFITIIIIDNLIIFIVVVVIINFIIMMIIIITTATTNFIIIDYYDGFNY